MKKRNPRRPAMEEEKEKTMTRMGKKKKRKRKDGADGPPSEREKVQSLFRRLSSGPVRLRVHDVVIRGNAKTKDSTIEAEVLKAFQSASMMQELLQATGVANERLRRLEVFDLVSITLDVGPLELPGISNVIIDVVEAKPLTGDIGIFTKPDIGITKPRAAQAATVEEATTMISTSRRAAKRESLGGGAPTGMVVEEEKRRSSDGDSGERDRRRGRVGEEAEERKSGRGGRRSRGVGREVGRGGRTR